MAKYAKPTPQAREFKIKGTNQNGLKRAAQIVKQRAFTYEQVPVMCISCGGPRAPHKHPVCDACARRRKEGMRS